MKYINSIANALLFIGAFAIANLLTYEEAKITGTSVFAGLAGGIWSQFFEINFKKE